MLTIVTMERLTSTAYGMEQLRLTVGLAHAVPGARVLVRATCGTEHTAGSDLTTDLHLCGLRQAIVASLGPNRPDINRWIEHVGVTGSLIPATAGVFAAANNENGEWWFATLLRHNPVLSILSEIGSAKDVDDDVEIVIKPDRCLGVSVVGLAARRPAQRDQVESVAVSAYTRCVVEEIVYSTRIDGES